MYTAYPTYSCSYYGNTPDYRYDPVYNAYACPYYANTQMYDWRYPNQNIPFNNEMMPDFMQPAQDQDPILLKDYGPAPFVVDLEAASKQNTNYRTTLWTGPHLQLTLMSINVGEDIGLEVHPAIDQFIRIEAGQALVQMGPTKYNLNFQQRASDGYAVFIPAGTWHNVVNTGNTPLKLYSIYAPPQHPHGTVHATKAIAHGGGESPQR